MVAQIHQGERIIPKADNASIMDAVNARPGAALTGGEGGGDSYALHLNASGSMGRACSTTSDRTRTPTNR